MGPIGYVHTGLSRSVSGGASWHEVLHFRGKKTLLQPLCPVQGGVRGQQGKDQPLSPSCPLPFLRSRNNVRACGLP